LIVAAISPASAEECIVDQQVVSDTVAPPGTVADAAGGSTVVSDDGSVVSDSSFVGDMSPGEAGCIPRRYGQPDLFYNFYTQGYCNTTNAQMYLCPHPIPPFVGHTFYTYQPFHPHEYLYWHKNRFHNIYDNGRGLNRTRAVYYAPPVRTALHNIYWNLLRLPR
jgi:hypothetical protein